MLLPPAPRLIPTKTTTHGGIAHKVMVHLNGNVPPLEFTNATFSVEQVDRTGEIVGVSVASENGDELFANPNSIAVIHLNGVSERFLPETQIETDPLPSLFD